MLRKRSIASNLNYTALLPVFICTFALLAHLNTTAQANQLPSSAKTKIEKTLNDNHIKFRENRGQWPKEVLYRGKTNSWNGNVWFMKDRLSFTFIRENSSNNLREGLEFAFKFKGANKDVEILADGKTKSNAYYFTKNTISESGSTITVNDFSVINYKELYPNIDCKYYNHDQKLKYDYIIKRGGNIRAIEIECVNSQGLKINNRNHLEIQTNWGTLIEELPESYQIINGKKKQVEIKYKLVNDHTFGFEAISNYNPDYELVIDPVNLEWSTLLGDQLHEDGYIFDVAVDNTGNVYGCGGFNDLLPTTGGQPYGGGLSVLGDGYIVKLNPSATSVIFSIYIGGNKDDLAQSIAIGNNGNIYISGNTESPNFPVTGNANDASLGGAGDAFYAVFSNIPNSPALLYATYHGGSGSEGTFANSHDLTTLAVNNAGDVYLAGFTGSGDYPTLNAAQNTFGGGTYDAYLAKFDANGMLQFSTYMGGANDEMAREVALSNSGEPTITGFTKSNNLGVTPNCYNGNLNTSGPLPKDVFVAKYSSAGAKLYLSYIGGSGDDDGYAICYDNQNNVYLTGVAPFNDFPKTAGTFNHMSWGSNLFVTKMTLNSAGNADLISSMLIPSGGSGMMGTGVAVNAVGDIFVCGISGGSEDIGVCEFQSPGNGFDDLFILKVPNNMSTLDYFSYFGGTSNDYWLPRITLGDDCSGEVVSCVTTHSVEDPNQSSVGFPLTPGVVYPTKLYGNDSPVILKLKAEVDVGFIYSTTCNTAAFTDTSIAYCAWKPTWTPGLWLWDFGDGTTSTLQNPTHTFPGLGTYQVKLIAGCPKDSITKQVIINQLSPISISTTQKNTTCANDSNGTANAIPTGGNSPYTYTWNTTPPQSNATATGLGSGTYSVIVNDINNCPATITVVISSPPKLVQQTTSLNITCNSKCTGSATITPSGGIAPYIFSWSQLSAITPAVSNLCAGNYTITVTDSMGCKVDTIINITQPAPLVNAVTFTNPHCHLSDGQASVVTSGGTSGYTYSWQNGSTTATISNIADGNHCVQIKDANNCADTVCIQLISSLAPTTSATVVNSPICSGGCNGVIQASITGGNSPYSFSWSNGSSSSLVSNVCAGTYNLIVTDSVGCSDTTMLTVIDPPPVTFFIDTTKIVCLGESATIGAVASGGNGAYVYTWLPGNETSASITVTPLTTTTYTILVADTNGCSTASKNITVVVSPPLTIQAFEPDSVCPGKTVLLSASASGGSGLPYNYTWMPGNSTGAFLSVIATSNNSYTVTVTDNCGSPPETDIVAINVFKNPQPIISSLDTTGCAPLCVTFNDNTLPQGVSNVWSFGDGFSSTNQDQTTHCFNTSGTYNVSLSVTDINGCSASITHNNMITVHPKPAAGFSVSPQPTTALNTQMYLTDLSSGAIKWYYDFGDGTSSGTLSSGNTGHYFSESDSSKFIITQIVTNQWNCTDTSYLPFYITPEWTFYVPNTFTPNGDGVNDVFFGTGIGILEKEMWIYDRWGNEIAHITGINGTWDGKVQNGPSNEIAQIDTYVWIIQIKEIFGKNHSYIGHVNIVK